MTTLAERETWWPAHRNEVSPGVELAKLKRRLRWLKWILGSLAVAVLFLTICAQEARIDEMEEVQRIQDDINLGVNKSLLEVNQALIDITEILAP